MAEYNAKTIFLSLFSIAYIFCLGLRSYFQIFSLVKDISLDEAAVVKLGFVWVICVVSAIICCILQSWKVPAFVKGFVIVWSVLGGWLTVSARDISVMLSESGNFNTLFSLISILSLILNAAASILVIWGFIVSVRTFRKHNQ